MVVNHLRQELNSHTLEEQFTPVTAELSPRPRSGTMEVAIKKKKRTEKKKKKEIHSTFTRGNLANHRQQAESTKDACFSLSHFSEKGTEGVE